MHGTASAGARHRGLARWVLRFGFVRSFLCVAAAAGAAGVMPQAAQPHAGPLHEYRGADRAQLSPGNPVTLRWDATKNGFVPVAAASTGGRKLALSAPTLQVVRAVPSYEGMTVDKDGCVYTDYATIVDTTRTKLFRSCDELATPAILVHTFGSRVVIMVALQNGTLFADTRDGANAEDGIWRSDDRGATWSRVCIQNLGGSACSNWLPYWNPGNPTPYTSQLLTQESIVSDGNYLYLGTYNNSSALAGNSNIIYRSADDGRTWQAVHLDTLHRHIHGLLIAPGSRLLALIGDSSVSDGIWYSDDHGVTLKPLVSSRTGDQNNIMVQGALNSDSHVVGGTDIMWGGNAIVDIDPATGVLTTLASVPYESFCARALPGGSGVLVGTVYEASGLKGGDPNLHLYAVVGGSVYRVYDAPIPNPAAFGFLCPVGVLPNGDVAVYRSGFGTLIVHLNSIVSPSPPAPPPPPPPPLPPPPAPVPVTPASVTSFSPDHGPVGSPMTISGTGFGTATRVNFNTVAAKSFTVDSPTRLEVTVPADATTGPITVTNAAGTAVSVVPFVVTQPPTTAGGGGSSGGASIPSGGGGGGGGAAGAADLTVNLSTDATEVPPIGGDVIYRVTVRVANLANVSDSRLDVTVSDGLAVTRAYSDRGPACSIAASSVSCDTAWISPGVETHVTIWTTVRMAGNIHATATARSLLEPELDPTNNTIVLRLPAVPTPSVDPFLPPPLALRAPHISGLADVGETLRVTAPAWTTTPSDVSYRWLLCKASACTPIPHATSVRLTLRPSFAGHTVEVIATGTFGSTSASSTSKRVNVHARR